MMTEDIWRGGATEEQDFILAERPSNPALTRISARSKFNTFKEFVFGPGAFHFNQGEPAMGGTVRQVTV